MRSLMIWLGRALANALAGGLAFAAVGAFCGGAAVFFLSMVTGGGLIAGSLIGAIVGAVCGIAGIFIHLLPALRAEQGDFWEPFFDLTARVSFGQFWGTIGACTAFIGFELAKSQFNNVGFSDNVSEDILIFAFAAPLLMICGATVSAIFKRD